MKYTVSILSEAEADIDMAYVWYEMKQKDLGNLLFKIINKSTLSISINPRIGEEIYQGVRRIVIPKFPYGIYYRVIDEISEIQIIGVINFYRSNRIIRKRL